MNPFVLIVNLFWKIVFWWKKQTGWLDLNETITVTGTIRSVDMPSGTFSDGDVCFNLTLDPNQNQYITGFGGRLTSEDKGPPALHCEITPWDRRLFTDIIPHLKSGTRVKVTGRWGFDGVHAGVNEILEILWALVRHQPYVLTGWFEIHPVTAIELL